MGDAFKNHVFPKYEKSRAMKPQMKGLEDPTLNSFSLLDLSALMKPELKDQMFEDEFIRSFLNAAKVLAAAGRTAIDRPSMYVILNHSYAIPVLFLTRHCMELAIKRAIRKCGREPKGEPRPLRTLELPALAVPGTKGARGPTGHQEYRGIREQHCRHRRQRHQPPISVL